MAKADSDLLEDLIDQQLETDDDGPQIFSDLPDTSESELTDEEASEKEEETEEKEEEEKSEEKDKWDKDKQMIEFERANARRAREELSTIQTAYSQANEQLNQLKQEITSLKHEKKEEANKLEDMDEDMVDKAVSKNIRLIENRLREKEKQVDDILKKISQYEESQAENQRKESNEQAKQAVFRTTEKTLARAGIKNMAKYRSAANELANHLVDIGQVIQPQNFEEAVDLMADCYLKVKERAEKKIKKKGSVSVDTGKGGVGGTRKKETGIKPGKLKDVKAQMLKDRSWLD